MVSYPAVKKPMASTNDETLQTSLPPRSEVTDDPILATAHILQQIVEYLQNLSRPEFPNFNPNDVILDLSCLCRTLLQVSRMVREGPRLFDHVVRQLALSIDSAKDVTHRLISAVGAVNDESGDYTRMLQHGTSGRIFEEMGQRIQSVLVDINRVLAAVP